jgi:Fe-S-cluster-containing hydrogenase component 2
MLVENIVVDMHACISCGRCVTVCPYGAIELRKPGATS